MRLQPQKSPQKGASCNRQPEQPALKENQDCRAAHAQAVVREAERAERGTQGFQENATPPPAAAPAEGLDVVTSAGAALHIRVSRAAAATAAALTGILGPGSPLPSEGSGLRSALPSATWPSAPRRRPGGAKKTRGPRLPPG